MIFRYTLGKVSDLEVETDEPYWSVNLKRGLLNILEVKLEAEPELLDEEPLPREVREAYQDNYVTSDMDDEVFTIKEVYKFDLGEICSLRAF